MVVVRTYSVAFGLMGIPSGPLELVDIRNVSWRQPTNSYHEMLFMTKPSWKQANGEIDV